VNPGNDAGPRREQLKINDNEIESQKRAEESQAEQPERHWLSMRSVLHLRTRRLQMLSVWLQGVTFSNPNANYRRLGE
jgi:hypothetical protein